MRLFGLILFLFTTTSIIAQAKVLNERRDTIHSKILNEARFMSVHIPEGSGISASQRFPVIYVLDGGVHFPTVTDILSRLYKETGDSKVIVVGIGNIWERDRDYTPTRITSSPWMDPHTIKKTGGGEKFISFLEKELIPYINLKYPASDTRVLLGHSFGGLAVINTLLNHTKLFKHYIAIDPSMWWDDQKLVKKADTVLSKNRFENNSLFIAVANTMNKEMADVVQLKSDTTVKTALTRPTLSLVDHIIANKQNKLKLEWKYYKEENHMSIVPSATYDALKSLLQSL